ncbi:MAG: FAD-dependent monooxygenase [Gemmatimonadales bacterium]|nr:FAD-dependent monooxygenase [Gemmatimonadales bacterium]
MTRPLSGIAARWDALVIGAGPAGAIAARGLARAGHSVLLVERSSWPRNKVCGSCLGGVALGVLDEAGLGGLIPACGARPLTAFELHARHRSATLHLPRGSVLSRSVLDAALVGEAARAGAVFLPEVTAITGPVRGNRRDVTLRRGIEQLTVRASVVLVAAGLGAESAHAGEMPRALVDGTARIGAGVTLDDDSTDYPAGTIYMACGTDGYVGVVRTETGELDIAAALDPAAIRTAGGIGALVNTILEETGLAVPAGLVAAAWRGTPPLTRSRTRLGAERLLLAGDAAGYVEPFTGEGIGWALASGHAVVPFAQRAIAGWQARLLSDWEAQYSSLIRPRQAVCRVLRSLLRHPALVRTGLDLLHRAPVLARPVIQHLNRALPVAAATR